MLYFKFAYANLHTTYEVTGLPWCDSDSGEVYKVYTVITEQYYNQNLFNLKPLIDLSQRDFEEVQYKKIYGENGAASQIVESDSRSIL